MPRAGHNTKGTMTMLTVAAPVEGPDLLTPSEVASALRVDPKTVTRWARAGKLSSTRTPGGHRRYLRSEVEAFLNQVQRRS